MGSGFGAGAGADMLQEILGRKLREAIAMRELANREADTSQRGQIAQQQLGMEGRRLDQGDAKFNYEQSRDTVGDQRYAEQAPIRATNLRLLTANAANAEGLPERTVAAQAAQAARDAAQHGYRMGEIGAQGANALKVAGARPHMAPSVFYDHDGKPHAIDFSSGAAVEVPLPGEYSGKTAPKPAGKTPDELKADAAARAAGTAEGKKEAGGGGLLDIVSGVFGAGKPKTIRARDEKGVLHEAAAGTALPPGWKLEK